MSSRLISVIIPVYNAGRYLAAAVDAVCAQRDVELEIILSDDGSTDGSAAACAKYAQADARIKVVHGANGGPSAARNRGLETAGGEYVFFMDADDTLDSASLKILSDSIVSSGSDWAIGDFRIIRDGTNLRGDNHFFPEDRVFPGKEVPGMVKNYLLKPRGASEFTNVWGKLFKMSIIRRNNIRFDESLKTWEDVIFNFDYLAHAGAVNYVHRQLYDYHVHPELVSCGTKVFELPLGFNNVLEKTSFILRRAGLPEPEIETRCHHAAVYFAVKTLLVCFVLRRRGKCGEISGRSMRRIIRQMLNDENVRQGLRAYQPSSGESRILPKLMKYRLVYLIYLVCCYKAEQSLRKEAGNGK